MGGKSDAARALLAFDVGNTSVKCALLRAEGGEPLFRVPTAPVQALSDRMEAALQSRRDSGSLSGAACVASSVHPPAEEALAEFCARRSGGAPRYFGRELAIPLRTAVREPQAVGADRRLVALGARTLCPAACVVVSAGTAITVDLVDADGCFQGGAIAPGFGLCAAALHGATALLPEARPDGPAPAPGKDTAEAVRAGVYWACAGGVLALLARYAQAAGQPHIPVVCTGTDAPLLLPVLPAGALHEPDLIFRGMRAALRVAD